MKITADTITDEQIEEMRRASSEEGVGIYVGDRLADMSPEWFTMRKRDARARCAEILNARAKEQR